MTKLAKWTILCTFFGSLIAGIAAAGARPAQSAERLLTLRALYGLSAPRTLHPTKTALVLVDFQLEFVSGRLALPCAGTAIERARHLVGWAHREGVLVVFVQQVATKPDSLLFAAGAPHTALVPELRPQKDDWVIQKSMAGAFSRTQLDARLRARGVDTLIIGGFMTHLAVQTTATDAMVLGFQTIVAGDATATRALPGVAGEAGIDANLLQRAALDAMADRVANVMLSREVMALPVEGVP